MGLCQQEPATTAPVGRVALAVTPRAVLWMQAPSERGPDDGHASVETGIEPA